MSTVLSKLRDKPGQTAQELGTTAAEMRQLESRKLVRASGKRKNPRGRPSVEWEVVEPEDLKPKRERSPEAFDNYMKALDEASEAFKKMENAKGKRAERAKLESDQAESRLDTAYKRLIRS